MVVRRASALSGTVRAHREHIGACLFSRRSRYRKTSSRGVVRHLYRTGVINRLHVTRHRGCAAAATTCLVFLHITPSRRVRRTRIYLLTFARNGVAACCAGPQASPGYRAYARAINASTGDAKRKTGGKRSRSHIIALYLPLLTLSRRKGSPRHLISASSRALAAMA